MGNDGSLTEDPAESGSKPSVHELWKEAPQEFITEAVARSSDDTRREVAKNMRDMLQEKGDLQEEDESGIKVHDHWEEIQVFLTTDHLEELKKQARARGITPSRKARVILQNSSKTDEVKEDSQTSNWQKISIWINGELEQELQEAAEEKEIDLNKEASIRLQEVLGIGGRA